MYTLFFAATKNRECSGFELCFNDCLEFSLRRLVVSWLWFVMTELGCSKDLFLGRFLAGSYCREVEYAATVQVQVCSLYCSSALSKILVLCKGGREWLWERVQSGAVQSRRRSYLWCRAHRTLVYPFRVWWELVFCFASRNHYSRCIRCTFWTTRSHATRVDHEMCFISTFIDLNKGLLFLQHHGAKYETVQQLYVKFM